jgi:hypothetical protein
VDTGRLGLGVIRQVRNACRNQQYQTGTPPDARTRLLHDRTPSTLQPPL